jgi:hypothetical protein
MEARKNLERRNTTEETSGDGLNGGPARTTTLNHRSSFWDNWKSGWLQAMKAWATEPWKIARRKVVPAVHHPVGEDELAGNAAGGRGRIKGTSMTMARGAGSRWAVAS